MHPPCGDCTTFGISSPFGLLSPSLRQVVYALLTRLPLDIFSTLNARPSTLMLTTLYKCGNGFAITTLKRYIIKHSVLKTRLVRLACVKHAASVRPEPGSNSPINYIEELNQALNYSMVHKLLK